MELSHTRGIAPAPSNNLLQLLRRHPLFFFFLMAYGFSWLVEIPLVLLHPPALLLFGVIPVIDLLGPLVGPALAAFLMTSVTEGKAGMDRLLSRYVLWRVSLRWYLFAVLGIPVVIVLGAIVLPGALASFHAPASPLLFVASNVFMALGGGLVGGPFFEEFGWRGFALPRMQRLQGPLWASLLLGVLWSFWHAPFFLPGGFTPTGLSMLGIVLFVLNATSFTVVMTWVSNNTRGSLLIAFLLHAAFDASFSVAAALGLFSHPLLSPFPATAYLAGLMSMGVVALLVVVLTRGRLSYERDLREVVLPASEAVVEQEPGVPGKAV